MSKTIIAADIGGTHVRVAEFSPDLSMRHHRSVNIRGLSYRKILASACDLIADLQAQKAASAIGLSVAGHVDERTGTIAHREILDKEPRLDQWTFEKHNIGRRLQRRHNIPVSVENDGNCACIAELKAGAARGVANLVSLTIGTYIGSGVVMRKELVRRRTSSPLISAVVSRHGDSYKIAGLYPCGVGLARMAREQLSLNIDGITLSRMAIEGHAGARRIFDEAGNWLGVIIASALNQYDPEMLVLNGPVTRSWELMKPAVMSVLQEDVVLKPFFGPPSITVGKYFDHAGLVGAAINAFAKLNSRSAKAAA